MLTDTDLRELLGRDVLDREGKTLGNLETFFKDRDTGQPEWLGVFVSGLIRSHHRLVPARGAEREGAAIRAQWTKDEVDDSPQYDDPDRPISQELEDLAYGHYGLQRVTA
jgi:hypothetical protein